MASSNDCIEALDLDQATMDSAVRIVGDGGDSGQPSADAGADGSTAQSMPTVRIDGRRILVDGAVFHMKGVNWNPVPRGGQHPQDLDFEGTVTRDAELMAAAGINVVRIYEPIRERSVLDTLWRHGIFVIYSVYPYGGSPVADAVLRAERVKDHPAILMWAIGNEWNYNGLYVGLSFQDALERVGTVARLIKRTDPTRPVATIYGETPPRAALNGLPDIDVWGINIYRGLFFGDLFDVFENRSDKPMFIAEYGADAYDASRNSENQAAQAEATQVLTRLIVDESTKRDGVCSGGVIFEWTDEWWKAEGRLDRQDIGGSAPGGGPHPDGVFNEEWWGLLDIDRRPRAAYRAYAEVLSP